MAKSVRKFHFLREIAAGGFGSVYLAKVMHNDGFSRLAAVKLLHQQWSENQEVARRMRDEARLLGWLRHRNIVDVIGLTTIGGRVAVVMEYLEAVDLKAVVQSHIDRGQPVPPRGALEAISFVASALDAAYNRPPYQGERPLRVIHRDIKPSNIMLDESGTVKVLDFGVARAEFDQRESHTQEMQFGSIEYMPPERLFMEPDTPASDVYSLGATLYELLALERFGKARSRPERHAAFLDERLQLLKSATPSMSSPAGDELIEFLRSLLAHRVDQRPGAADVVARCRALSRTFDGDGLTEWAETVIPPLVKAMREAPREPNPLTNTILMEDDAGLGSVEDDVVVDDENSAARTGVRNPVFARSERPPTPPRTEAPPAAPPVESSNAAPVEPPSPEPFTETPAPVAAPMAEQPVVEQPAIEQPVVPPVAVAVPVIEQPAPPPAAPEPPAVPQAPASAPEPAPPAPPVRASARSVPGDSTPRARRSASATIVPDSEPVRTGPNVSGADVVSAVFLKSNPRSTPKSTPPVEPPRPSSTTTLPGQRPLNTRGDPATADPSAEPPSQTTPALHPVAPPSSVDSAPWAPSMTFVPEPEESPTNVSLAPDVTRTDTSPEISRTQSTPRIPPQAPPSRSAGIGTAFPGPSRVPAPAPLLSEPDEEPPPRSRTGWIVAALVVLAFLGLSGLAGAYAVYAYVNAPIPEVAVKDAPGEAGDVLAGGPRPADPVTGDVVFISAAPETAKVTLTCDGKETTGVDHVAMTGTKAELCLVKVMLKDRTRMVTEVHGVEKGTYTCFTNDEKSCVKS